MAALFDEVDAAADPLEDGATLALPLADMNDPVEPLDVVADPDVQFANGHVALVTRAWEE